MLLLLIALQEQAPPQPRREVPDSGIIAVDQRVTPAGVQSVFTGRVYGVRFGAQSNEIWVIVPGAVYRLGWRDNVVLSSAKFDGRAGVQGVVIDPVNGRALISSVGRLAAELVQSRTPGSNALARTKSVAQLIGYDSGAVVRVSSPALGDFMAGAPAVARRANASGHRVAVVPLPANDALAVLDADSGALLRAFPWVCCRWLRRSAPTDLSPTSRCWAGEKRTPLIVRRSSAAIRLPSSCVWMRAGSRNRATSRASIS